MWHLTQKRVLQHNHELSKLLNTGKIHSRRHVLPEMDPILRRLLTVGITGEAKLRRYVELQIGREIDRGVFHNQLRGLPAAGRTVPDLQYLKPTAWLDR